MNTVANAWAELSQWLFPAAWMVLGAVSWRRRQKWPGAFLVAAGASGLVFAVLFAPGSWFTANWETDAPLNVAFDYRPLGFILANGLPALMNVSLVLAIGMLSKRKDGG